jgi:hypothetical protein
MLILITILNKQVITILQISWKIDKIKQILPTFDNKKQIYFYPFGTSGLVFHKNINRMLTLTVIPISSGLFSSRKVTFQGES